MPWIHINEYLEYNSTPPDPGIDSPFYKLWLKQANGIRNFKTHEVYTQCRRIGTTVDTFGELSKSYYDRVYGPISFNFIDLDQIANAYYEIASPITFSGDFEIELDFETTDTGTDNILLGKAGDGRGFVRLKNGTPSINFSQAAVAFTFGSNTFYDGELHTLKIENTSGTIKLFVDGVLQGTTTPADISNTNFDAIGHKSGQFFDGIIANAKLTDKSGASDVVTTFRLDNSAAVDNYIYGSEEVTNGDFATNTDWVSQNDSGGAWSISNGSANVNATSNSYFINSGSPAVIKAGSKYLVSYEIKNYISGAVRARVGGGFGTSRTANGIYSQIIGGAATSGFDFECSFSSGFNGSVDNVSVKEITNYSAANAASVIEYSQENVFGSELITNGDFSTDSNWLEGAGWSIDTVAGTASTDGTGNNNSISQPNVPLIAGSYELTYTILSISSGQIRPQFAGGGQAIGLARGAAGTYTEVITTPINLTAFNMLSAGGSGAVATIDNISIKKITNAVEYQNIAQASYVRDTYTLIEGDWVGSELVTNGNFATDSDWDAVINATVTATNNTLEVTTTSQASGAYQNISTNAGAVYTFTATASSFVSGALIRVTDGTAPAAGFAESQVVDGTAVLTFTAVGSITNVYLRNTVAGTSVWTSASVKRLIEVAS